jgi:hypothetical protein
MISKETREKIVAQSTKEIAFDRRHKQGKTGNWAINEALYYGRKLTQTEARANVDLGRMQEFVHTLLSKIDNPLVFKFLKKKEAQLRRVQRLNALRQTDSQRDSWDIKDLVGKKQGIIYGRAVYSYYADSENGYRAHLNNADVYDYLIDPAGGGIDLEQAMNMGDYGVILSRADIEAGVESGIYIKEEADLILAGTGNNNESNQEQTNKRNRTNDQGTIGDKELQSDNKFKFWRWFTTYYDPTTKKSERYYLLMQENGRCLRVEFLTDLFSATKDFPKGAWPYWSWAAFPDLTEFWTPSYCDYVREIFMAQNVSINQMLDNAEQVNKPMKVVNVGAIENLAELKYRRDGIIKTKGDFDANRAVQLLQTPSITTPISVYNLLEAIQEKASGVTAGAKGVADEEGKVGIYEGNQEAQADRFGLLNKSYSFGYTRFARLYEIGVRDHLTKKTSVDILGPEGIETEEVSKRDIFRKNDDFAVLIEASNAETLSSVQKQSAKLAFLNANRNNAILNPKKALEMEAVIAGYTEEEIKQLTDLSEFGNIELMAEAERDIEALLDGDDIKPNKAANNAYKQRFVDYMKDHEEDMTDTQKQALIKYVESLANTIMVNETRSLNNHLINILNQRATSGGAMPTDINTKPALLKENG